MIFKKNARISTSDFLYDLFDGGYIKPEKLLKNKDDINRVNEAMKVIEEFIDAAEAQDVVEYR